MSASPPPFGAAPTSSSPSTTDDAGREATERLRTLLGRRAAAVTLPDGVGDVAEIATHPRGRAVYACACLRRRRAPPGRQPARGSPARFLPQPVPHRGLPLPSPLSPPRACPRLPPGEDPCPIRRRAYARTRLPIGEPAPAIRYRNNTTTRRTIMANGNHNSNGHHRNGTGNGLVHSPPRTGYGVNGNGHRPETAPVSSTGQAIVPDHDLLWDGLPPAVTQRPGAAPRSRPRLTAQGTRRAHLLVHRGPRRHLRGQQSVRLRRMGLRAGRRRDAQGDRERRSPDRRGEAHSRLQRTGSGHRARARLPAPTSASTP